jgi:hypothetical protein
LTAEGRSNIFAGKVSEGRALEGMLNGLSAPLKVMAIKDAGIATEEGINWLFAHD